MLTFTIIAILSYLIGNISTSYIVAKRMSGIDIRTQGSGNAGSTNVLRTLGKKAGIMTFVGDVLKGVIAVFLAGYIAKSFGENIDIAKYIAVVFVVTGHNWPVFLGFKGGKGVATSLGAMIAIEPILTLVCLSVFIVIVYFTKYVSLGAIICISCSPILMIIAKNRYGFITTLFLATVTIYSHRQNIVRLINKTESKIGEKKKI